MCPIPYVDPFLNQIKIKNKLISCLFNFTSTSGEQYVSFPVVLNILVLPKLSSRALNVFSVAEN